METAFVETNQYRRFREFCDACRKYNLGKRDVDRLVSVVRTMFA